MDDVCEVFFSNGQSLRINMSQRAFIEQVSTEEGVLDNRLILIKNKQGEAVYVNPLQVVSISTPFALSKDELFTLSEQQEDKERAEHNLEAIQDLSENIDNME
ncbi:MAG: hypothetical protein RR548_02040 [Carnobacterium sp.]|uniref:Uncharacterized protein n=1 Tax=Carnobacterium antarcticum TaxID=2126436 RepID=A0ABW4NPI3_9LACT|nr:MULTISPECIES: hypothetical protein [unclassified Carnobacterium]ALV21306.1 hypothetical protein NY10_688 [Carnobacterium sp. CP1]QQP69328.1 hypothetical protein JHE06_06610 [Carnobacterium sp. CS13]